MKKIKYMLIGFCFFIMLSCITFSSLYAQDGRLTLQVYGTLLIKNTEDTNSPIGIQQEPLTHVFLHMEFQGMPVMGRVQLISALDGNSKGVGDLQGDRVMFMLNSSDIIESGEMYLFGEYRDNEIIVDNRSAPFPAVVFKEDAVEEMTIQKGAATTTFSSGTLECGILSSSDCNLTYEVQDSSILKIDESGEMTGLAVGTTDVITKVTIPNNHELIEVSRTSVKVEETNTPEPPTITTEYTYTSLVSSLQEGYEKTKIGSVEIENSDASTPATHYYGILDTTDVTIDNAGFVYAEAGMSEGECSFTITIYKDAAKTDVVKTLQQTITITSGNAIDPEPDPNPDENPTPNPNTPTPEISWIDLPSLPASGWYNESITLKVSDEQSDFTQMAIDDGVYATSFILDRNGVHSLNITFKNPVTNEVTSPISVQVKMDQHRPIIEEIQQDAKEDTVFTILASDALSDATIATSGLDKITYTIYQVVSSTEKIKLEEKEVNGAETIKLSTTATGDIEICAFASDKAKLLGEEKCTDFTIRTAEDPIKNILKADNEAGTIEIYEKIPTGTKFRVEDITKHADTSEMFNDTQQVRLALRLSLGSSKLTKTAKVELPLSKDILALTNTSYYMKGKDGTLEKLNAKVVNEHLVFETNRMGDVFVITPKDTKPDTTNIQTSGDGDKVDNTVNEEDGSRNNGGISTGDITSINMYLLLCVIATLSISFYVHQRRVRK